MRFADRFGLSMGPLVLRVLLGATFIWAGLGKVLTVYEVTPADSARLAQMGVQVIVNAPQSPPPEDNTEASPTIELPEPEAPEPDTPLPPSTLQEVSWTQTANDAQPADFPNGGTVRTLYSLSLMIDNAANPGLDAESNPIKPIWPASLATGPWPKNLAWLATLTEIGLGFMLLIGLFTRLSALGIASVMGTAAWLTVIGPAIQLGNPVLGFLPNHDAFDVPFWQGFAWQLSLIASALAVLFMGSGSLGLDRALFRPRQAPLELDPPVEIPGATDMNQPRGPFDRSVEDDQS